MRISTPTSASESEVVVNPVPSQSKQSGRMGLIAAVIVALVAVGGVAYAQKDTLQGMMSGKGGTVAMGTPSGYQAVFLTNGQVYFGEIDREDSNYIVMNKVFYLQVKQPLQQGEAEKKEAPKPELNLVKLGTELHGPTDEMRVSRAQVLFTETLKEDSQVVKGIGDYYTKNN